MGSKRICDGVHTAIEQVYEELRGAGFPDRVFHVHLATLDVIRSLCELIGELEARVDQLERRLHTRSNPPK
ncbi:MAG: hypothetical protein JSS51_13770 [Planctomycetes bacterium]|nr:hypothetical protein [Planctomycetota bacterium]